jgi:DNA-directed RNA polymerase, mitochondrial
MTTIDTTIIDHPLFERQVELEQEMRTAGVTRFRKGIEKAMEKGAMAGTQAVNRLVVKSHEAMVEALNEFIGKAKGGKAGRRHTSVAFIDKLDVDSVANITARVILDEIARKSSLTKAAIAIGSMLENEVNSRLFAEAMPKAFDKFHEKAKRENLEKRRWSHLLFPARLLGCELEEWSTRDQMLVGMKLVELFQEATGLVDIKLIKTESKSTMYIIEANEMTMKWMEEENKRLEHLFPVYMPTIVPPKAWTSPFDGGYYTVFSRQLRLVKTHNVQYLDELAEVEMPDVYAAVNALQETAWAVNGRVLDVMEGLYKAGGGFAKIPHADPKKVEDETTRPLWLPTEGRMEREEMTPEQLIEFTAWKASVKKVFTDNALMIRKRQVFTRTLGVAHKFRNEEAIYFPHTLDWRGRAYPMPLYLQPQGNDMQRGLLTFANTVPINDEQDAGWLAIHGAGVWGFDKVSMEERIAWVYQNEREIIASAENPYDCRFWMDADKGEKPWQFLAFCFEWAAFRAHGFGYESSLPIQMDGTCNGLQNFSAMLLDSVGGSAVNLVPADQPQDIYQRVADLVARKVEDDIDNQDEEIAMIARGWAGNVTRKVTKRPVMTLAYGARKFGFVSQVDEDTIREWRDRADYPFIRSGDDGRPFDYGYKAASYMGGLIWDSVGEVVVAARQAMDWLQEAARVAGKQNLPITWTTPTGFLVQQAYRVPNAKLIDTTFNRQRVQVKCMVGVGKIDSRRQASGISPNWVHSLDASHLMKTIGRCKREGISSFSMIHDSYGTHAGNAWAMAEYLRDEFVQMYSNVDVLSVFKEQLEHQVGEALPDLPAKGDLDLDLVRESAFFFA